MANLMNKVFKNKSTQRFILSLKTPQQHHQPHLLPKLSPSTGFLNRPDIFLCPKSSDGVESTDPLKFYPNFPFGYFLNPSSLSGFDQLPVLEVEAGTEDGDVASKVWADSVKKKRKKKMNKHKYKKLRKRLRRKT